MQVGVGWGGPPDCCALCTLLLYSTRSLLCHACLCHAMHTTWCQLFVFPLSSFFPLLSLLPLLVNLVWASNPQCFFFSKSNRHTKVVCLAFTYISCAFLVGHCRCSSMWPVFFLLYQPMLLEMNTVAATMEIHGLNYGVMARVYNSYEDIHVTSVVA